MIGGETTAHREWPWIRQVAVLAVSVLLLGPALAQESSGPLDFFGDFRLRLEQDWDSIQGDGSLRDDRLRLRIRLRGGFRYHFNERWSAMVQARSGPDLSQQSPHITIKDFDGGASGPYEFNFDHWYLAFEQGGFEGWAGRNVLSFLHQDDLFVFDNVTYPGFGGSYRKAYNDHGVYVSFNYVLLPVGMTEVVGDAIVGEFAYQRRFENAEYSVALGYRFSNGDPDDPAGETLLTENSTRDYRELSLQLQYKTRLLRTTLQLGADIVHNMADYANEPEGSFSEFHKDDVSGYVLEVLAGDKRPGNFQIGYFYSHLEALSVNSSYIQDDWVRWGNANQVRATNMKGSEFRFLYTVRQNVNIFARLFFVDAIDLLEPGDTDFETGNRFRIELNWAF